MAHAFKQLSELEIHLCIVPNCFRRQDGIPGDLEQCWRSLVGGEVPVCHETQTLSFYLSHLDAVELNIVEPCPGREDVDGKWSGHGRERNQGGSWDVDGLIRYGRVNRGYGKPSSMARSTCYTQI